MYLERVDKTTFAKDAVEYFADVHSHHDAVIPPKVSSLLRRGLVIVISFVVIVVP